MTAKKEKKNFNFAKAYKELEDIAEEFESGNLSLEDGLKKFERGLLVAKDCREYLTDVENKIIEIKDKYNKE
jgi:exodeoxyribonuclease VII small subunit